jgi:uncharacterized protein (TIGR02646 family)
MRRFLRPDLAPKVDSALARKQRRTNTSRAAGALKLVATWNSARKTKPLKAVLATLKSMVGQRERCMYCGDSHATDIDHFWPKAIYPQRMFCWPNLLLSCTDCGRIKGTDFPLQNGEPLLVDPTAEDPWRFLDFDPATGNLVPRFDPATATWDEKGENTVQVLELDRREALAAGYQKTHRRLTVLVEAAVQDASPSPTALKDALHEADEHGLLGWCFSGTGQTLPPFCDLRQKHPAVWEACAQTLT